MSAMTMTIHFSAVIIAALSLARPQSLLDVGLDALRNLTARTSARLCNVPCDALFPRGPLRHAMPLLVHGQDLKASHGLDDVLGHLLGVAEQHHGIVAVEQGIVDAGIARGQRALDEHHGARL